MRPTLPLLYRRFQHFNTLCFNGELPSIHFSISRSLKRRGSFRHPVCAPADARTHVRLCQISLSDRFEMTEDDIDNVLLHEMIHYFLWLTGTADPTPHGPNFLAMAKEINQRFNRNITVTYKADPDMAQTDNRIQVNYLCISHLNNGKIGLTNVAKTRIFELDRLFRSSSMIKSHSWFGSVDKWFNKFPRSRTGKIYYITQEELDEHIAQSTPCEIVGNIFRPINVN